MAQTAHPLAAPKRSEEVRSVSRLREQVLRRLMKVGCACIPDLVNELDDVTSADELEPVIRGLLDEGLIRRLTDNRDPRKYTQERTVYELVK